MPDIPTSAPARPDRIQRRTSTVPLATHAEALLPIDQLLLASGPLSPSGDVLPADTAIRRGER